MRFTIETNHKVATNPVARAIARTKLNRAMTHMGLRIYTMQDGEDCRQLLEQIGFVLALMGMAGELDPAIGLEDSRVRIIRGALSAINQMSKSGKWDSQQSVALEHGLSTAVALNPRIKQAYVMDAWDKLQEMA